MKIAFTSDEKKGLDSVISYHFGHCPYFIIVELDDENKVKEVKSIDNPYAKEHNPGELPSFMYNLNINMIVTGGMGPRAQEFFAQYGVKPVIGAYGKVKDVLKEILNKEVEYERYTDSPQREHSHKVFENEENTELEKLKLEIQDLRRQIADIKSLIFELREKID